MKLHQLACMQCCTLSVIELLTWRWWPLTGESPLAQLSALFCPLGQELGILSCLLPSLLTFLLLQGFQMALSLESAWSNKALDFWGLVTLGLPLFQGEGPLEDVLTNIVIFVEGIELPDLSHSLWPQSSRDGFVSKARDVCFSLLHHHKVKDAQGTINNAATHRFASPLSSTTGAEARLALFEEELDTTIGKDTLLHGETLLVISSRYTNSVPLDKRTNSTHLQKVRSNYYLPLITQKVTVHFLGHTLVIEWTPANWIAKL